MNKTGIFITIFTIIYSFTIGYISFQLGRNATDYSLENLNDKVIAEEVASPSPSPTPEDTTYVVKEYNNKIGVYQNDELIRIVDVNVDTLGADDQQLLKNGITVHSKEELAGVLEDYSS